jgi:tetratricopeptide (TPR) repeat protein
MKRPLRSLLASISVLLAQCGAASAAEEVPDGSGWSELASPNFSVLSNADERKSLEIVRQLERFRSVLALLRPGARLSSPVPTTTLVFKSDRSLAPYKRIRGETASELVGFFAASNYGNFLAVNAYPPSGGGLEVVYHEYVHFFVRHNLPNLPLWANEGLAEYYSTYVEVGGEVVIGTPLARHLRTLRRQTFIPLPQLFALDTDSEEYGERDRVGLFYAQSWALMHYLLSTAPEQRDSTGRFLAALSAGDSPEAAARQHLGVGLGDLEARLRGYVNGRQFRTWAVPAESLPAAVKPRVEAVLPARALSVLGDLLARINLEPEVRDSARQHYRAALALDPESADARAGLGWLAREEGRVDEAVRLLREAVARRPSSPLPYLFLGETLVRRLQPAARLRSRAEPTALPLEVAEARRALAAAAERAPDFAEIAAAQGASYFVEPSAAAAGIAYLERAARELPERSDILYNLAMLLTNAGRFDEASATLERRLALLGKPDLLAQGREAVERARLLAASSTALGEKRFEEAEALSRRAVAVTTDPELRAELELNLLDLERQVREARQVARFNEAVRLSNQGQWQAALDRLGPLADEVTDDELSIEIEKLRFDLERSLARQRKPR